VRLGTPRLHLRRTDSTNACARELAARGAPHGTLVTAAEQTAGRGRQGRTWSAPAGRGLLCSLVVREPSPLLSLAAGVAVAEVVGDTAGLKWPNDVMVDGRKVAGILVEGRPQERWAVVGIGINVALEPDDFPPELRDVAGTLGLGADQVESVLERLLEALDGRLGAPREDVLAAYRARDLLLGQRVQWEAGHGLATGVDDEGRLSVATADGPVALGAGEVHLSRGRAGR
jgi:BirA family transcriptional regulator, biotin operon repressor / biotin---[acetyl-CoA-carboxylase] ligase